MCKEFYGDSWSEMRVLREVQSLVYVGDPQVLQGTLVSMVFVFTAASVGGVEPSVLVFRLVMHRFVLVIAPRKLERWHQPVCLRRRLQCSHDPR